MQRGGPEPGEFRPLRAEHLKRVLPELMSRDRIHGNTPGDDDGLSKVMWDRVVTPQGSR